MHRTISFPRLQAACAGLLQLACSAQVQALTQQSVLVLNSYDESTAPFARARSSFMAELQQRLPEPVAFRQFDLEARGAEEAASQELKAELLRSQYANSPPGLVVALGPPAIGFWLEYRDRMFPAIPFIAVTDLNTLAQFELRPGDAAAVSRFSFAEVVEGILELLPETRRILMVFGASDLERGLAGRARRELANAFPGLETEFTNELGLRQLEFGQIPTGYPQLDAAAAARIPMNQPLPGGTMLQFPWVLMFGVSWDASPSVTINLDGNFTRWSAFKETTISIQGVPPSHIEHAFTDTWTIRAGVGWQVTKPVWLGAGFVYDQTPQPDFDVGPLLPDSNRSGFSVGAGLQISKLLRIDISSLFLWFHNRTITTNEAGFNGTYKTFAILPGLRLKGTF